MLQVNGSAAVGLVHLTTQADARNSIHHEWRPVATLHDSLGFVEHFKPLPSGLAATKHSRPERLERSQLDMSMPSLAIDDGTQRDPRPDDGRHIALRLQAHHRGAGESIVNRCECLLVKR